MLNEEFEFDVFLSHNSKDKPVVETIAHILEEQYKLRSWLDKWDLIPGDSWQKAIGEALNKCRTFAVFIGKDGIGSWESPEMEKALDARAKDRNRRVIPVLLPGAPDKTELELPPFLPLLTWVDLSKGYEAKELLYDLYCGITGRSPRQQETTSRRLETQGETLLQNKTADLVTTRGIEINQSNSFSISSKRTADTEILEQPRTITSIAGTSSDEPRTVYSSQLNELRNYQANLKKYVDGYLISSERWAQCSNVKSALDKGKHKNTAGLALVDEDWDSITSSFSRAVVSRVLPDTLIVSDEFKDLVEKFNLEMDKTRQAIEKMAESPDSLNRKEIDEALKDGLKHINNAIMLTEEITKKCNIDANIEMSNIEGLIKTIGRERTGEVPRATESRFNTLPKGTAPEVKEDRKVTVKQGQISILSD